MSHPIQNIVGDGDILLIVIDDDILGVEVIVEMGNSPVTN